MSIIRVAFVLFAFAGLVIAAGCGGAGATRVPIEAPNPSLTLTDLQTYMTISPSSGPAAACVGTICTGSCSSTACSGGEVPATYGLATMQPSPSLDGKSTLLSLQSDPVSFVDALYYIKTGPRSSATNFTYDLYFYVDNANPVALEFDLGTNVGGYVYNMSSQCLVFPRKWQIWNAAQIGPNKSTSGWIDSPLACPGFAPNTWHHLTWTYAIVPATHQTLYKTLAIDGAAPMAVNTGYPAATPNPVATVRDELTVQIQLDAKPGAAGANSINEWVDKVTLTSS